MSSAAPVEEKPARRKAVSTAARSLAKLRSADFNAMAGTVEKFNQHAGRFGIRQDLFGFMDILAVVPGLTACVGVQTTVDGAMAPHLHKLLDIEVQAPDGGLQLNAVRLNITLWLAAGNRLWLWGWKRPKGAATRWSFVWKVIYLEPGGARSGFRAPILVSEISDLSQVR